ncbi:MAG TPA: hypothetical protein VMY78_00235 [Solirubrobacteraceae bacterium]|nr:hypothetical protein [Solirubrobacteraceae bacterium]
MAPSAIPGQSRRPPSTRTASAMPVGGQTAVTLEFSEASASPPFAAAT